jgi:hypothetical protein
MSDHVTRAEFVRRNLRSALGLGAAAVIAKTIKPTPAKAWPVTGCFLKGTKIATPKGERAIESLIVGDLVNSHDGPQAIKTIYRFEFDEMPICIQRSAFAADVPDSKLYLTFNHAIWTEGGFATAESLCNGRTIYAASVGGRTEYFHLELPHHTVIYANNLACESMTAGDVGLALGSRRSRIKSHLRSAFSPWIDRRQPIDRVRDQLGA